jgi:hypothetical protein
MSKKSRRRNKKILGALLLGGLGLAARNKRNAAIDAGIQSAEDDKGSDMLTTIPKKKPAKVYQDSIMRGGTGVKAAKQPLRFGQVIDKQGEVKTIRPFESAGLKLGISNRKGLSQTEKAVNKANRQVSKGMLPPQLRNPGRTNITTDQGNLRQSLKDIGNFVFPKANFKSGGKVKGCGKALRGFGRAMKKGKK